MNRPLKLAIVWSGLTSYRIEQMANLPITKLSRIVHGVTQLTEDERRRIAETLKVSEKFIFPEKSGVVV